jgi:hypothetical protein
MVIFRRLPPRAHNESLRLVTHSKLTPRSAYPGITKSRLSATGITVFLAEAYSQSTPKNILFLILYSTETSPVTDYGLKRPGMSSKPQ